MLRTKVEIRNFRVHANVGCTENERCEPQELAFDIQVYFDARHSLESDRIDDTIDYMSIKNWTEEVCKNEQAALIEHLADLVTRNIYKNTSLAQEIHLTVRKFTAISSAECVAFGIETVRGQNL